MDTNALAELLFSHITRVPADYEALYPPRNLPEGARVTRMAPSPTGFLHIGALFGAMLRDMEEAHHAGRLLRRLAALTGDENAAQAVAR